MNTKKTTPPKFSISLLLLVVIFEVIFLRLAYWQYERMNEKQAAFVEFENQLTQQVVPFSKDATKKDWQSVTLNGVFDYDSEKLLQNRHYRSYNGYRIITPFLLDDGHYVMVDRGWIPKSWDREPSKALEGQKGQLTLHGVVRHIPPKRGVLQGPLYGVTKRVMKRVDSQAFPMVTEYKEILIQASSSGHPNIRSFIEKPRSGGSHSEYMLTWLCLALIVPSLYLTLILSQRRRQK